MPAVRPKGLALSDEDVASILALTAGADSVELKLTVPEASSDRPWRHSAWIHRGADPAGLLLRDPDLALDRAGVVVRARRCAGRGHDSVVKLRPATASCRPSAALAEFRRRGGCDAGRSRLLGVDEGHARKERRARVHPGGKPLRKLFSKEQRAFYEEHAPDGRRTRRPRRARTDLRAQGQVLAQGLHRMVAEVWLYPDDSRILELSTKCAPNETFQVAAEGRAYLTSVARSPESSRRRPARRSSSSRRGSHRRSDHG